MAGHKCVPFSNDKEALVESIIDIFMLMSPLTILLLSCG